MIDIASWGIWKNTPDEQAILLGVLLGGLIIIIYIYYLAFTLFREQKCYELQRLELQSLQLKEELQRLELQSLQLKEEFQRLEIPSKVKKCKLTSAGGH